MHHRSYKYLHTYWTVALWHMRQNKHQSSSLLIRTHLQYRQKSRGLLLSNTSILQLYCIAFSFFSFTYILNVYVHLLVSILLACWHYVAVSVIDSNSDSHNYEPKLTLYMFQCAAATSFITADERLKGRRGDVVFELHTFFRQLAKAGGAWYRKKSLTPDTKHSLVNPFLSTFIIVNKEMARLAQKELSFNQLDLYLLICW